jgi:hypothetical protein
VYLGGGSIVSIPANLVLINVITHKSYSGSSYGLIDGGLGGMIYTYIGGITGFTAVVLSMAEMASMQV